MNSQAASAEVNASIRPQAKGGSVQCFVRLLDAQEADRAKRMPDEQAALNVLFGAWLRLKELGWQEAEYCPKDGSEFKVIEAGSTGFHDCVYLGEWPTGGWWVHDGDTYPSRPILWKPNDQDQATDGARDKDQPKKPTDMAEEIKSPQSDSSAPSGRLHPLVRRFGYHRHPHPIIRKSLPEEIQVGWQFEDSMGAKTFVAFGCTRNRESLKRLIEDVQRKHGPIEVVDLDVPNDQGQLRREESHE